MNVKSLPESVRSQLRNATNINNFTQCVTELVLNSLDAQSSAIAVRINLIKFTIQIIDNGTGITKQNLEIIGNRFMTSKCHSLEDLKKIRCFGFRGEALASIKGMCKSLTIMSRSKDVENTYSKTYKNGKWEPVVPIKHRPSHGTTIIIEGFLNNLPVRQKRINQNLDMENVRKMLESIALINFDVSFTLRNDATGKSILKSSKSLNVFQALNNFYPHIQSEDLLQIKVKKDKISVSGLIYTKSTNNNKQQYVYLNKRLINSAKIQKIVNNMLIKSTMFHVTGDDKPAKHKNEHPMYIINIRCPYTDVDLTLSPSKQTVIFKNWDMIMSIITKAVTKILEKGNYLNPAAKVIKTNKNELNQCKSQFGVSQIKGVVKSVPLKRRIVDDIIDKPASQVEKKKKEDVNDVDNNQNDAGECSLSSCRDGGEFFEMAEPGEHSREKSKQKDGEEETARFKKSDKNQCKKRKIGSDGGKQEDGGENARSKESGKNQRRKTKAGSYTKKKEKGEKTRSETNESMSFPAFYNVEVHTKRGADGEAAIEALHTNMSFLFEHEQNSANDIQNDHDSWKGNKNNEPPLNENRVDVHTHNEILNQIDLAESIPAVFELVTDKKTLENESEGKQIILKQFLKDSLQRQHEQIDELEQANADELVEKRSFPLICFGKPTLNSLNMPQFGSIECFRQTVSHNITYVTEHTKTQPTLLPSETTAADQNFNKIRSVFCTNKSTTDFTINVTRFQTPYRQNDRFSYFNNHILRNEPGSANFIPRTNNDVRVPLYQPSNNRNNFFNVSPKITSVPLHQMWDRPNERAFPYYQELDNGRNAPRDNFTNRNNMPLHQENNVFQRNPLVYFSKAKNSFNSHLFNNNYRFECENLNQNQFAPQMAASGYNYQFPPPNEFKQPRVPVGKRPKQRNRQCFKKQMNNEGRLHQHHKIFERENQPVAPRYCSREIFQPHKNQKINKPKTISNRQSNFFNLLNKEPARLFQDGSSSRFFKIPDNAGKWNSCPKPQRHTQRLLPNAKLQEAKNPETKNYEMINTPLFPSSKNELGNRNTFLGEEHNHKFSSAERKDGNYFQNALVEFQNDRLWQQPSKLETKRTNHIESFQPEKNIFLRPSKINPVLNHARKNSRHKLSLKKFTTEPSKPGDLWGMFPKETERPTQFQKYHTEPFFTNVANVEDIMSRDLSKEFGNLDLEPKELNAQNNNTLFVPLENSYPSFENNSVTNKSLEMFDNFKPEFESTGIIVGPNPNSEVIEGTVASFDVFIPSLNKFQSGNAPLDFRSQIEIIQKGVDVKNNFTFIHTSLNDIKRVLPLGGERKQIKDDDNPATNEDDWIQLTDDFGGIFYINKRTGMTSKNIAKQSSNFTMSKRIDFVPKGLSPVLKEVPEIEGSLSPTSKVALNIALMESYQNELNTIKWSHYIDKCGAADKFFEELYLEKTKQFDKAIPNANVQKLPKSMIKFYNNLEAESFTKDIFADMLVVGQVDKKFIAALCEEKELLVIFDQHAAHERIRLEQLIEDYKDAENSSIFKSAKCQEPIFIELSKSDINILETYQSLIRQLGLQFTISKNGIEITHIPTCVYNKILKIAKKDRDTELKKFIDALIQEEINTISSTRVVTLKTPTVMQNIINSEACRGAIKFGDQLTFEECEELIKLLSKCDLPFQCAHGRPTITPLISLKQNYFEEKKKLNFKNLKPGDIPIRK